MNYLYWLSQIQASQQSLVGEQIFILSQLLQQNFPILPGFVVSDTLFREFLANIDDSRFLISNMSNSSLHLDIDNYQVLQSIAIKSCQAIDEIELNQQRQEEILTAAKELKSNQLILRPFFFPSHYPQKDEDILWDSQPCFCTKNTLSRAIKKVWKELFSAKSLLYWNKLNIPLGEVNCNILIQPLQNAIASGTVELKPTTIFIQSTWGLADSLDRGEVEPDTYIVKRNTGNLLKKALGNKTCGYRLNTTEDSELKLDCVESYFLTELESDTDSLTSNNLKQLVKSIEILIEKRSQIRYLKWTLLDDASNINSIPQFYWTKLNYFAPFSIHQDNLSPIAEISKKPLLTGLGVAPGKIIGDVVLYDQFTNELPSIDSCILVTKTLSPNQITLLPKILGIITEKGSITSHTAIIARELGIPAIVNANRATTILKTGDLVMLDGDRGEVHHVDTCYQPAQEPVSIMSESLTIHQPLATRIMVNLSNSNTIDRVQNLPIDGVGLLRGELMLLEMLSSQSLAQWLQPSNRIELLEHLTNLIRKFVVAFFPRPVFYRSVDWNSKNFNHSEELEFNPMVGDRGTYHYLLDPTLFDLELTAISNIQQEGYTNINLVLPFVRSVEEFKFCQQRVENFGLKNTVDFELWLMAEVPSVIFLLPQYIEAGVQGIIIGANDFTQLILGVDREHSDFSRLGLNINHPAVLNGIFQLCQTAKKHNLPCAIAIHNPVAYPNLLDKLIQWDISMISVESEAISSTYQEIARSEKRLLLDKIRRSL